MCTPECNGKEELDKLPSLLRDKGYSCSDVRNLHKSFGDSDIYIQGSSGPTEEDIPGIRVMTGTVFQVYALEDCLKVRVAWPGLMTTNYTCFSAEQVVFWLSKILPLADQDTAETLARLKARRVQ